MPRHARPFSAPLRPVQPTPWYVWPQRVVLGIGRGLLIAVLALAFGAIEAMVFASEFTHKAGRLVRGRRSRAAAG